MSWFLFLKYLGTIIALFYGVFATFHDFQKGGKTRRIGLIILICGTLFALSADFFKDRQDWKEKVEAARNENERLTAARLRERAMTDDIRQQLRDSEKISLDLFTALELLNENAANSSRISGDLSRQLGATKHISNQLSVAARSLEKTSQTANSALLEAVDRMDYVEVHLVIALDPLAIKDANNQPLLSKKTLQLFEEDRMGRIDISEDDDHKASIIIDVQQPYAAIRHLVFANWNLMVTLDREDPETDLNIFGIPFPASLFPDILIPLQGDTAVASFSLFDLSDEESQLNKPRKDPRKLICLVRYLISPSRYAGFRKYTDLNGITWGFVLQTDSSFLDVTGAAVTTGIWSHGVSIPKTEITISSDGTYKGQKKIPGGFFKPAIQAQSSRTPGINEP
jgi:hypothetical protein